MEGPAPSPVLVEVWRGSVLESVHRGRLAVCTPAGALVAGLGDTASQMLPRSACKMLQALALVESGAADAAGLAEADIALAAASHSGAPLHVGRVTAWLGSLGLGEGDLRCGAQPPWHPDDVAAMACAGAAPDQRHNNCSGKHCGFLTLNARLGGGPDYTAPDHPVQRAVLATLAEMADETPATLAIDGCSAPNPAIGLAAFATALARFAAPAGLGRARGEAARRLYAAIAAHPVLVAGQDRPNSALIAAARGRAILKSGAEGVYAAAIPGRTPAEGLGIAVKIEDGAERAARAAIAAALVALGALDPSDPVVAATTAQPQRNRRGIPTGEVRAADTIARALAPR